MRITDAALLRWPFLLTNGRYGVTLTRDATGSSSFGALALTRDHDGLAPPGGFFVYVRDLESGTVWSAGRAPIAIVGDAYEVRQRADTVVFVREHDRIRTTLTVALAAGLDAEVRDILVENLGDRPRHLDVTTYAELVLNAPGADAAHPAFSKLFVQTEWDTARSALFAHRRQRSPDEEPVWVVHQLRTVGAGDAAVPASISWETDRMRFLGRGRTPRHPAALDPGALLSETTGSVLDPVFSLRAVVALAPRGQVRLEALLGAGRTRTDVERVVGAADVADALPPEHLGLEHSAPEHSVVNAAVHRSASDDSAPAEASYHPAPRSALPIPADPGALRFFNGWGGFSPDGTEYVIPLDATPSGPRWPPMPWANVIANEHAGFVATESGAGFTWAINSRENRITPWSNDPVSDPHGEAIYLRDDGGDAFWSPLPGPTPAAAPYEVRHGFGYSTWAHTSHELEQVVTAFVPRHDSLKIVRLRLQNRSRRSRRLTIAWYARLVLGDRPSPDASPIITARDEGSGALFATNPARGALAGRVAFGALALPPDAAATSFTTDAASFLGQDGRTDDPVALRTAAPLDGRTGEMRNPCVAFETVITLAPEKVTECSFLLGEAADAGAARALVARYHAPEATDKALEAVRTSWRELLAGVQIETPAPAFDLMVNGWLAYQDLSCRIWGRSAFYQSGGAFGFRDQLQDAAALVYLAPALTRAQILLHAAHQFVEGDVLHWWHPPASRGIRTRFTDDLLWLPYIAAFYVASTGDTALMDASAPFLTAPSLAPGEDEVLVEPRDSGTSGSVYEHCARAIDRSLTVGAHGLPLIGSGDWNDGMNRVGAGGRGESVWLGFFLFDILGDFIPLCERRGDAARAGHYRAFRSRLGTALNEGGWDGVWYRRAYYDDGTPLGSAADDECRIDAIAQAWAVLSGATTRDRAIQAMDALETHLVSEHDGIIRLLAPPFDRTRHDPGYIKGYLPGVRENGGQYTHGVIWAVRALAELGRCERAAPLLEMLTPVAHTTTANGVGIYRTEPYVVAADVYGIAPHVGHGGWTWYTGSAGWMLRTVLESVLGMRLVDGERITLRPCIPASWPGFTIRYRTSEGQSPDGATAGTVRGRGMTYEIAVQRAAAGATTTARVDGHPATIADGAVIIPLARDGGTHHVLVHLGGDVGPRWTSRLGAATARA